MAKRRLVQRLGHADTLRERSPAQGPARLYFEMSDYSSRRSMRFSTRSEYGIRVMVRLGRGYGLGPISLADLAEGGGPGECTHADMPCSAHAFWERLQGTITSTMESVTVADLMKEAQPA